MGIWSRNKGCRKLGWALTNSFVGKKRARKGFVEEVIFDLDFAV